MLLSVWHPAAVLSINLQTTLGKSSIASRHRTASNFWNKMHYKFNTNKLFKVIIHYWKRQLEFPLDREREHDAFGVRPPVGVELQSHWSGTVRWYSNRCSTLRRTFCPCDLWQRSFGKQRTSSSDLVIRLGYTVSMIESYFRDIRLGHVGIQNVLRCRNSVSLIKNKMLFFEFNKLLSSISTLTMAFP